MTTIIANASVRQIALGIAVTRTAATLPQTATQNIFTISGGRILLVHLGAQVTTVIGGTATTVSVNLTPTAGTAGTTSLATATAITSKEVGTLIGVNTTLGGALVVGTNASVGLALGPRQVLQPGTVSYTTSASTTGALSWDLVYVPLDIGAQVVAA